MHSLIISATSPPVPGVDIHGVYQRLGLFVRAMGRISDTLHLLHFLPPHQDTSECDPARLAQEQSDYWGTRVSVSVVAARSAAATFQSHYLDGLLSGFRHPDFLRFRGPTQVEAVTDAITATSPRPDLVLVHGLGAMSPLLSGGHHPARLFFDLGDVEHKVRLRAALQPPFWPGKLLYMAHTLPLLVAEAKAIHRSRQTFVCSDVDRRHLERLGFRGRVSVVPNAVSMPPSRPISPAADKTILFLGDYTYLPNRHAAERMVARIWPVIHARFPDATLTIAGRNPQGIAGFSHPPAGVTFPGFVDDLGQLYDQMRVVCCPLMTGGGTRLKLIEGASFGKPIVSTRVGAEGLDLRDGAEIMLRDHDDAFAAACIDLLTDDEACARLGQAARTRVQGLYASGAVESLIETQLLADAGITPAV